MSVETARARRDATPGALRGRARLGEQAARTSRAQAGRHRRPARGGFAGGNSAPKCLPPVGRVGCSAGAPTTSTRPSNDCAPEPTREGRVASTARNAPRLVHVSCALHHPGITFDPSGRFGSARIRAFACSTTALSCHEVSLLLPTRLRPFRNVVGVLVLTAVALLVLSERSSNKALRPGLSSKHINGADRMLPFAPDQFLAVFVADNKSV